MRTRDGPAARRGTRAVSRAVEDDARIDRRGGGRPNPEAVHRRWGVLLLALSGATRPRCPCHGGAGAVLRALHDRAHPRRARAAPARRAPAGQVAERGDRLLQLLPLPLLARLPATAALQPRAPLAPPDRAHAVGERLQAAPGGLLIAGTLRAGRRRHGRLRVPRGGALPGRILRRKCPQTKAHDRKPQQRCAAGNVREFLLSICTPAHFARPGAPPGAPQSPRSTYVNRAGRALGALPDGPALAR